jgi:hypothetical protein
MLYFDTSFLAPLILEETTSAKIEAFFTRLPRPSNPHQNGLNSMKHYTGMVS